jgi:hypothetical protein
MRNIESSPWLEKAALVEIKSVQLPNNAGRVNEFTLNLQVKRAALPDVEPAPAPAKAEPGKAASTAADIPPGAKG